MKTNIIKETDEEGWEDETDFDLVLTKEEREKFKPIIQRTEKSCALCSFNDEVLNFNLFYKQIATGDLRTYLMKKYYYAASDKELDYHRKHIELLIDDKKEIKNTNKDIKKISKLNNLEDVERIDAQIQFLQNEMNNCQEKQGKAYIELTRLLAHYISLKNDITKGKTINVNIQTVDDLINSLGKQKNI